MKNLIAQREHLKTAKDGRRATLAKLWDSGIKTGTQVEHHQKMMQRSEDKLQIVYEKIFQLS